MSRRDHKTGIQCPKKQFKEYMRQCERCNDIFKTKYRSARVCENCYSPYFNKKRGLKE